MLLATDQGEFEITDVLLQAWITRYPGADLRREYPLMVLWLTKNPSKKPRNPIRFIENWLKRAQTRDLENMQYLTKRGSESAERMGARFNVKPHIGETQEAYNRRVIAACGNSIIRRVA